eukprot:TRINITY_DN1191_c0_g1_i2.p2 TRINITY_DN1191_c0_g1~~TRINITY_DN1191_c0_g1_i2.p2  ORF type:complete len:117 (-),score=8.16 TRINITY_DN1191_c0_g1_i2:127-435(-)
MSLQFVLKVCKVNSLRSVLCSSNFIQRASYSDDLINNLRKEYPRYREVKTKVCTVQLNTTDADGKPYYEVGAYVQTKEISKAVYQKMFVNFQRTMLDIAKTS